MDGVGRNQTNTNQKLTDKSDSAAVKKSAKTDDGRDVVFTDNENAANFSENKESLSTKTLDEREAFVIDEDEDEEFVDASDKLFPEEKEQLKNTKDDDCDEHGLQSFDSDETTINESDSLQSDTINEDELENSVFSWTNIDALNLEREEPLDSHSDNESQESLKADTEVYTDILGSSAFIAHATIFCNKELTDKNIDGFLKDIDDYKQELTEKHAQLKQKLIDRIYDIQTNKVDIHNNPISLSDRKQQNYSKEKYDQIEILQQEYTNLKAVFNRDTIELNRIADFAIAKNTSARRIKRINSGASFFKFGAKRFKGKSLIQRFFAVAWHSAKSLFSSTPPQFTQPLKHLRSATSEFILSPKYHDLKGRKHDKTLKQICSGKLKNNIEGKQKFHEMMRDYLSEKISFTDDDKQAGLLDSLTSLVLVEANLMTGRAKEGDYEEYRGLDSPVEKATKFRLPFDATKEDRNNQLLLAKKRRWRPFKGKIKSSHLDTALNLIDKVLLASELVKKANHESLADGQFTEIKDVDEAAKQKLIDLVQKSKKEKLPKDLKAKLEAKRKAVDFFRDSDLELLNEGLEADRKVELLQTNEQISLLENTTEKLEKETATSQERMLKIQMFRDDLAASEGEEVLKKSVEDALKKARFPTDVDKLEVIIVNRKKKIKNQLVRIKEMNEELAIFKNEQAKQADTYIEETLKATNEIQKFGILSKGVTDHIIQGIMFHCGVLVPGNPLDSVTNFNDLVLSQAKITNKQRNAIREILSDVCSCLKKAKKNASPISTEDLHKVITQYVPVSAFQASKRLELLEDGEDHPLEKTDFKEVLSELMAESNIEYPLFRLREDTNKILLKASILHGEQKGEINQKMLDAIFEGILEKVVLVDGSASSQKIKLDRKSVLQTEQIQKVRDLAHSVQKELTKEDASASSIAKHIYSKNTKKRKNLASALNSVWVK